MCGIGTSPDDDQHDGATFYNMADTYFVGKLGTSATGAIGVVFALMSVIQALGFMLGLGIGQGFQPVSGFNYGAKKYDRVRSAAHLGCPNRLHHAAVLPEFFADAEESG